MSTHPQAGPQDCCVLTPAQHKVVALLSAGSTITAAARAAGVHRNTVATWRRRPAVQAALQQAMQTQETLVRGQADALVLLRAALAFLERQGLSDSVHPVHSSAQPESLVGKTSGTNPIPKIDFIPAPAAGNARLPEGPQLCEPGLVANAVHPPHNSAQPGSPIAKTSGTNPIPKMDVIAQPACGSVHPAHNPAQPRETERTNPIPAAVRHPKVGRNQPCPCGSGKKFKRCCRAAPAA